MARAAIVAVVAAGVLALAVLAAHSSRSTARPPLRLALVPGVVYSAVGDVPASRAYVLRITGTPGDTVRAEASGVPRGWVASFCTPKVCAPFRVSLQLPSDGTSVSELHIIPSTHGAHSSARIRIEARDARSHVTLSRLTSPRDAR